MKFITVAIGAERRIGEWFFQQTLVVKPRIRYIDADDFHSQYEAIMTTLADLHRAVQTTLASKRLGTPVFVRYLYHAPLKGQAVLARLAKTTATVRAWLAVPLERVLAQGTAASRHVTLLLEFRGGLTAVVTWIGTTGRGDGVDLTVIGNHGAIYHDSGDASLWEEALATDDAAPERDLVTWIERAIKSARPEDAQGGKR